MRRFNFRKTGNWWQGLQNSFKRWFSRRVKPKPKGGKHSHGKNNTSSCLGNDKIAVSEGGKTPIVWRVKKGFMRTNCTSMTCSQEKVILPIFHSGPYSSMMPQFSNQYSEPVYRKTLES